MDLAAHPHRIVEVDVVGAHRLRVAFEDGLSGEVDASNWEWHGVFEPFHWPNGADVAPETLHHWVARARDNVSA